MRATVIGLPPSRPVRLRPGRGEAGAGWRRPRAADLGAASRDGQRHLTDSPVESPRPGADPGALGRRGRPRGPAPGPRAWPPSSPPAPPNWPASPVQRQVHSASDRPRSSATAATRRSPPHWDLAPAVASMPDARQRAVTKKRRPLPTDGFAKSPRTAAGSSGFEGDLSMLRLSSDRLYSPPARGGRLTRRVGDSGVRLHRGRTNRFTRRGSGPGGDHHA
jgi:hypothetical protein